MDKYARQEALRELISGGSISAENPELQELAENDPQLILEELLLTRLAYETWRDQGQAMHRALLEIWHIATPWDTSHMTFGDDPETVVESVRRLPAKSAE